MSSLINLEREFFKVAKDLESKSEVKRQFLNQINNLSEDWINNKFRFRINGLKK
jgi:hypothetical protein